MPAKRKSASRRLSWPEPGRENGGEFRLTWGRISVIFAVLAAIPSIWAIGGHYMNRDEIEKAMASNKADADRIITVNKAEVDRVVASNKLDGDRALKDHAAHDSGVQAWNQYNLAAGLAANRVEYLDDRQAECDAKAMTSKAMPSADKIVCERIAKKLQSKNQEVVDLKAKAMEATKETAK